MSDIHRVYLRRRWSRIDLGFYSGMDVKSATATMSLMNVRRFLLAATLLFAQSVSFPNQANATNRCSNIDLSSKFGPLRSTTTVDPNFLPDHGLGWCGAYAAADLLTARLGTRISGADVGISFNHILHRDKPAYNEKRLPFVGIDRSGAQLLLFGKDYGFCPESVIRSDHFGMPLQALDSADEVIRLINGLNSTQLGLGRACSLSVVAASRMFPKLTPLQVSSFLPANATTTDWKNLAKRACDGQRMFPKISAKGVPNEICNFGGFSLEKLSDCNRDALKELDTQLSNRNPVELVIAIRFPYLDQSKNEPGNSLAKPSNRMHSTVIDRRVCDANCVCRYRVRPNWGPSTCRLVRNCENGFIWVDRKFLEGSVKQIGFLTN